MPLAPNLVVRRDGILWRVTELTPAVGGGQVAQLECLERDAHAAVDVERLDDLVEMAPEQIEAAIARRETREAPRRLRQAIALHRKRITKCEATRTELLAARNEAALRLQAGDLKAVENRQIVPGQVVRIEPAGLVKWADAAIAGLDAAISRANTDMAADEAALAKLGGAS